MSNKLARSNVYHFLDSMTSGAQSLREFKENICALSTIGLARACYNAEALFFSSTGMLFCGFFGVILLMLGGGFGHFYWFKAARKRLRLWTLSLFIAAPLLFTIGVLQYTLATDGFSENWLDELHLPVQQSSGQSSFSKAYVMACTLALLSFLPLMLMLAFAYKSPFEDINEELSVRKHEEIEATREYLRSGQNPYANAYPQQAYGAMGGMAPAPMASAPNPSVAV
eukprot:gnl/TRDRNA2_/TRDRNA2_130092_c0_seq1.p1 gnl/TRDRNA2_/TRDRNA2_130092_c0~~gnl/TRDRNA2_/TRDRNA2_130092_c0_seq1.p1  ORF type:complete len:241 (+),score=35.63 gnl/TRDRNA2_/TRDRNA2_130092_c0_seq1:48-725(+)